MTRTSVTWFQPCLHNLKKNEPNLFSVCFQIQWKNWLESSPNIEITPSTPYADIIVPTIDTIRTAALLEKLVVHKKQVGVAENFLPMKLETIFSIL